MAKVLILSDLWVPFPGGAERLMFNLGRHLLQRGNEVSVLTGYEFAEQFDGPPVVVNLDMPLDASGAHAVADHIASVDPDVVLVHHVYALAFGPLLRLIERPVVQVVLNGARLDFAAFAVFISKWVRWRGDADADDLTLIPPAMPDVVAPTHGDAIGFVKPLPHKGAEFVYRIAAAMPDCKFKVLRGEWQDLEIIRHDLPNVEYVEPVRDIRDWWSQIGLVLVPSISEDAGTVGQEAAVNGVPCISSNAGGLPETNGGVVLGTFSLRRWVRMIRYLEDPRARANIVQEQRRHYASLRIMERMDEFAERVEALAWTRS